jgi:hypothetical protein
MNVFERWYRDAVFFVGDVKKIDSFPWVTWATKKHKVRFEEIMDALPLIQYGDVGIHRDLGYLSNVAIPGFMKHAWIHTSDMSAGDPSPMIVEAISEGVVHRSAIYPMYSDYTIILRPKNVGYKARRGACKKAKHIVGTRYDHEFEFDVEKELAHYNGVDIANAELELGAGVEFMKKYDCGFSCTEAVSYAWWHEREKLRIYREKSRGKQVVLADSFLNGGWEIVWMSDSVTEEAAEKFGMHEEGLDMIAKFLR